jgi:hypothetical protein
MNTKQRILTYLFFVIVPLTLFFVPWRVSDQRGGHYELSAYWHPVPFDEGGVLRPVLLYVEWGALALAYGALLICLRSKREHHP